MTIQELVDRQDILDIVVNLFVATDNRDWTKVEACLAEEVVLDMTSLTGGEAVKLPGVQISNGWQNGLKAIDNVHHQIGNFRVEIYGNEAKVFCYGIAFHHRRIENPNNVRTFVGSYDIHLVRGSSSWLIDIFRFNAKFVSGNLQLETAT